MSQRFNIRIGTDEREVFVERTPEGFRVVLGEREFTVSDVVAGGGTMSFLLDRRNVLAHVSNGGDATEISLGGRNYRVEQPGRNDRAPDAGSQGGDGRVCAPMPGSIVSVCVREGDIVEADTPLVVLESMKMQNELSSPIPGTVAGVMCEEGQQVGFGDVLVRVDPRADSGDERDSTPGSSDA